MNSSRMRTVCHLGGGGGDPLGGAFGGVCGQTDARENITFPHTPYAVGKNC